MLLAMDTSRGRYVGIIYGEKNVIKRYLYALKANVGIGEIHMSKLSKKLKGKVLSYISVNKPGYKMFCITIKLNPNAFQISRMSKKKAIRVHRASIASAILTRLSNKGITKDKIDEVHADKELDEIARIMYGDKYIGKTEYCELADIVSYLNSRKIEKRYNVVEI